MEKFDLTENLTALSKLAIVQQNPVLSEKIIGLRHKDENKTFQIVVLGQYKRGKTSLINALLGEELLPVAIVPLTSIITILEYGETEKIIVNFQNGSKKEIKRPQLSEYITELKNPKNEKQVEQVLISLPSDFLAGNIQIIDTPGIGSVYQHNTDVALEFVPKADAGIFVVTADPPIGEAELDFLHKIKNYLAKIIFVQNKIDQIDEKERRQSLNFTKGVIEKAVEKQNLQFFPISAKLALEDRSQSQIESFKEHLDQTISTKKDEILESSLKTKLKFILDEILLQLEIQEKALTMSQEELSQKITLFKQKVAEIKTQKEDTDLILLGKTDDLTKNILIEDIESLKEKKLPTLLAKYDSLFKESVNLDNRNFVEKFNQFLEKEIKEIFSFWRKAEERKIKDKFQDLTSRFSLETNQFIHQILEFSANIFKLQIKKMQIENPLAKEIEFKFSFDEYEVDIDMFTPTVSTLPKFIARRLFYSKMKEDVVREFDKHCGRSRYDFTERIKKSISKYQEKLDETLEETINGIETVLKKTLANKEQTSIDDKKMMDGINQQKQVIIDLKSALDKS